MDVPFIPKQIGSDSPSSVSLADSATAPFLCHYNGVENHILTHCRCTYFLHLTNESEVPISRFLETFELKSIAVDEPEVMQIVSKCASTFTVRRDENDANPVIVCHPTALHYHAVSNIKGDVILCNITRQPLSG